MRKQTLHQTTIKDTMKLYHNNFIICLIAITEQSNKKSETAQKGGINTVGHASRQ